MVLTQDGDEVKGTYTYNKGGVLEGKVNGNRLKGKYIDDKGHNTEISGPFEFIMGDDGTYFDGNYKYEGQYYDDWFGKRIK